MSDLKDRIYQSAKEFQLVSFATVTPEGKPWVRYVMASAGDDLVFRFCSRIDTRKVEHIRKNPNVHLLSGVKDLETAEHWLQVAGTAELSTSKEERHAFWFDMLKNYFTGPDDPAYCIIIIRPTLIEFGTMGSMTPEVWQP